MIVALVNDYKVTAILEDIQESRAIELAYQNQNVVDVTNRETIPNVGWNFINNDFVSDGSPPYGVYKVISKLKFAERFTSAELSAIEAFAWQNTSYAAALRADLRKQMIATYIDLSLPQIAQGLSNLVALGLLTSERASTILNTPVSEAERYKGEL